MEDKRRAAGMAFDLTDEEFALIAGLPIEGVVDLAAELDILAPEQIDRRSLVNTCVLALVEHARKHGLPLSKYDADDLAALDPVDLQALATLVGVQPSVAALLKHGDKVYRGYSHRRIDHPIPLMLPMLLSAVARAARAG